MRVGSMTKKNCAAGELAQRIVQDLPEYDKASWGD